MNERDQNGTKTPAAPEQPKSKEKAVSGDLPGLGYLLVLVVGIYLGILFTKTEVARWQRIHDMFLMREPRMYLIIGLAIAVAMISMLILRRLGCRSLVGTTLAYQPKPYHTGVVLGGILFGAGWAITGACPGPIYAQIGSGHWIAILTLLGALVGTYCYGVLKPRLPH